MGLYRAVSNGLTVAANPTDVVTIIGSPTRLTRVFSIELVNFQTTFGINTWYILKRTSLNTYSTLPTAMTAIAYDSSDPAATSACAFLTVNPTSHGSSAGIMSVSGSGSPSTTTVMDNANFTFDFRDNPILLRGSSELLSLNFAGAAKPAGFTLSVAVIFDEA